MTDLAELPPLPDAHVYFDRDLKVDRLHAERIAHVAELHPGDAGGHFLVKLMRDSGKLIPLLQATVSQPFGTATHSSV